MDRLTRARVLKGQLRYLGRKGAAELLPSRGSGAVDVPADSLDDVLSSYEDDVAFVHVGLSAVNSGFEGNPYEFLRDTLTDHFESILATGYTPAFRDSGVYHKEFSMPEFGTFSRLFLADADYRTDDAIHSLLVEGDYRFDDADHHDSFGPDSCRSTLEDDDVLCLNVGTDRFVCLALHYLEGTTDLPYVEYPEHEGVIYYDETDYDHVTQRNYAYTRLLSWNNRKIRRRLEREGVVTDHSRGGLRVHAYRFGDVTRTLRPVLADDPYYLVT